MQQNLASIITKFAQIVKEAFSEMTNIWMILKDEQYLSSERIGSAIAADGTA